MNNGIPDQLKGYEVIERIGAGGFGAVYRAKQTTINREVAIKFIIPSHANQPDFIRRFEIEAQLIARLEHPHITPLIDYWRDLDGAYLVMRYLRGGSVRNVLDNGAYDLDATSRLLDQIASALEFAHRHDVIHRDIKPGNILLDEDDNAYLADFGIAKDLNLNEGHTSPDAVVGSLDYISPEQARSEPITPRTDIYSLGVMLYEMITGEHPFKEVSPIERLFKHINDPLPEIDNLPQDLRDTINDIIQKATAKDPSQRYEDALALAIAFREGSGRGSTSQDLSVVEQLTLREHEILQLIADGLSNRQIAEQLFITIGTVKWHVNQLYKKLGIRNRVQAIVRARELNLIITDGEMDNQVSNGHGLVPTGLSLPEPENPYKGLHAFQTADARDFYGRQDLIQKLIAKLGDTQTRFHRFLAVVGPSGSGKSSLVKAGVIPALWKGGLKGSEKWFVVDMMPGTHPLDELEIALTRVAANQSSNLTEHLQRDERGLVRAAGLILPQDDTELVVVIDQFEETFTLVEDEATRQHFLDLLRVAVTDNRSRVRVIVTLRADYYDKPLHYPQFGEILRKQMETVLPLSAKGLERAVSAPAERVGVAFEPGLVTQIVSEMTYQVGALPLLQYALTELFEQREGRLLTTQAYKDIGGAVGALANRADEIFLSFNEEAQELTHQLFLRLVTLGEGAEDTRRRTDLRELLSLTENSDMMEEIIDAFSFHRLLSLDHDEATRRPTVEVAHEALIRSWDTLREWLDHSREDLRIHRRLTQAVNEWQSNRKDPGYLISGIRLEQFASWAETTELILNVFERTYLDESMGAQIEKRRLDDERKAREAEVARRAQSFQRASIVLGFMVMIALAMTIIAGISGFNANNQSATATNAQGQAIFAQNTSVVREQEANIANTESAIVREDAENFANSIRVASRAQNAFDSGLTFLGLTLALEASYIDTPPQTQRILLDLAYASSARSRYDGHSDAVRSVAFSPDGRQILSGSDDHSLILWDVDSGDILRRYEGHSDAVRSVAFSPDGRQIVSGSSDNSLILWDVDSGDILRRFEGHIAVVESVAFSPDGSQIVSGSWDNQVILWDIDSGDILRRFEGQSDAVFTVAFSPDGSQIVSGSWDNQVILWDVDSGDLLRRYEGHSDAVFTVAFSPDGRQILSGSWDNSLILWDVDSGDLLRRYEGHSEGVFSGVFSFDGSQILSGSWDNRVILWDVDSGDLLRRYEGHSDEVFSAAFSPDGRQILSGSLDKSMILWDVDSGDLLRRYEGHSEDIYSMAFSPDGSQILSGSFDKSMILWDVDSGDMLRRYEGHNEGVWSVAFSPDGSQILSGSQDKSMILWDVDSGDLLRRYEGHSAVVWSVAFSPDGSRILSGSQDNSMILWDIDSSAMLQRYEGHSAEVRSVAFSPDGSQILSGSQDNSMILWDIDSGDMLRRYEGHNEGVSSVAFSPDGSQILSGSQDNSMILWDVDSGDMLRRYEGHNDAVFSAAFSPDGSQILSGSQDNSMILWDVDSGDMLRRYEGHSALVWSVAFSPDGSQILSGSQDNSMILWRNDSLEQIQAWVLENRVLADLTCQQGASYGLDICSEDGIEFAAPTLAPTRTVFPVPTALEITNTPFASPTASNTPTPSNTPHLSEQVPIGTVSGEIATGGYQRWTFESDPSEPVNIYVNSKDFDTILYIYDMNGNELSQNDDLERIDDVFDRQDSGIEDFILPDNGGIRIEIRSFGDAGGGRFTLTIEQVANARATPTLTATAVP